MTEHHSDSSVIVRKAVKRFGNQKALDRLDLTVTSGTIYALLGPSGCGKSTLLQCILGRIKPDSGQIYVDKRLSIGYMPQEIALYTELSVEENLTYYGKLCGLDYFGFADKIGQMTKFLELPSGEKLINQLSGGEQRRVSFGVSLLSNSDLLILDEPTVGVDMVLCSKTIFYVCMILTMSAALYEMLAGRFERTLIMGGTLLEACISQMATQMLVMFAQLTTIWIIMYVVYDFPFIGSHILGAFYLAAFGVLGMIMGLFVALACQNELWALLSSTGLFFSVTVTSGVVWPLEGVHWLIRKGTSLMPLTNGVDGFRNVAIRGWTLTYPSVYQGLFSLIAWSVFLIIGCVFLSRTKR